LSKALGAYYTFFNLPTPLTHQVTDDQKDKAPQKSASDPQKEAATSSKDDETGSEKNESGKDPPGTIVLDKEQHLSQNDPDDDA
jgi:hypothetical protein